MGHYLCLGESFAKAEVSLFSSLYSQDLEPGTIDKNRSVCTHTHTHTPVVNWLTNSVNVNKA